MKILFLISGRLLPASRFRVLQYLPRLEAAGHECTIAPSIPPKHCGFRLLGNRASELPRRMFRVWDVLDAWRTDYDVVFLERELFSTDFVLLERMLRRVARTLVLDVDDALFVLHPRKFETLVHMSDCVIAGNRLLHEKVAADHSFTVEIPTVVDLDRYVPGPVGEPRGRRPVIGWTGLASNIPYLEIVAPALRNLARRADFELRVVAEDARPLARLDLAGVNVRFVPWSEANEIDVLRQFDMGLMPLPDDGWTRFKCGLKLIQYMALGIPGIASPIGVNTDIVRHGETGFLAETPSQWMECMARLLSGPALRKRIGYAGREDIADRYTLDQTAPLLIQTLELAAAGCRARPIVTTQAADERLCARSINDRRTRTGHLSDCETPVLRG
jgi:glycosyltransferase involved in cell wall biosynthesis